MINRISDHLGGDSNEEDPKPAKPKPQKKPRRKGRRMRRRRQSTLSAKPKDVRWRYLKAAHLKARGLTYKEIAQRLGWSTPQAAYRAVKAVLTEVYGEDVDILRAQANMRLDIMSKRVWPLILDGQHPDLDAVSSMLAIESRRAALNGTDMPKRVALEAAPPALTWGSAIDADYQEVDEPKPEANGIDPTPPAP